MLCFTYKSSSALMHLIATAFTDIPSPVGNLCILLLLHLQRSECALLRIDVGSCLVSDNQKWVYS